MAYKLIGKDFTPVDVVAKVTGRAKYAEDFRAERMAFCKTLSSPMPHARIRNIDTSSQIQGLANGDLCVAITISRDEIFVTAHSFVVWHKGRACSFLSL